MGGWARQPGGGGFQTTVEGVPNKDRVQLCSGAAKGRNDSSHNLEDGSQAFCCFLLLILGSGKGDSIPGRGGEKLYAPQHHTGFPSFHSHLPSHHSSISASLSLIKMPEASVCAQGHEENP